MNDRIYRRAAAPKFTHPQHSSRCEHTQREFGTSAMGSKPTSDAAQHCQYRRRYCSHERPIAAIHQPISILRCGPSFPTFAAMAKSA